MRRSVITATGSYLPKRILTNEELSRKVDTTDEWIVARSGIEQRYIAADGELTSDLATHAAKAALEMAGLTPDDIDLIVLATATPDETFPATATVVQKNLGMTRGFAFDIQAVCTGFLYALATADNFVKSGQVTRALVIGAETFSRILDWEDRATCVLFGDGAGAFVLEAQPVEEAGERGVMASYLRCDGRMVDLLYVDGGPSRTQSVGHLRMIGNQVFKHAVNKISDSVRVVAREAEIPLEDIDWFVPHQANQRILTAVARNLGVPEEQIISTVAKHGNTSAASVPLALADAEQNGKLKKGDLVLIEAIGGGLAWGAGLFRL